GWKADINIRKKNAEVVVESDLVGVSSPLPEPLNKTASTPLQLRVEQTHPDALREQYRITLGKVGQGVMVRRGEVWERGVFAVGDAEPRLPEKGLAIRVATPRIDADTWKNYLPGGATGGGADPGALALSVLSLKTPLLRIFDRDFNQVETTLRPREGGWQIGLNTREAVGELFWRQSDEGWVEGRFKRFTLRPTAEIGENGSALINSLPGMNLAVDDLRIGDRSLGKLDLKARNDKGTWNLDALSLQNPDGGLKGKGVWTYSGGHQTRLDFELTAKDAGRLLDRLGYADSLRRGSGTLSGNVEWGGPLTSIHYPSLSGQLSVNVEKGQFNRLEPGVGKLLGLISLQSLPRRLTLDFRDIFTDGLAFDSIEG
ncbi:MAG: TIGR02099 family protein, partial [Dechloromonas sp.]|nr:TIGR02099 family protein [Dechloromonas sp.]